MSSSPKLAPLQDAARAPVSAEIVSAVDRFPYDEVAPSVARQRFMMEPVLQSPGPAAAKAATDDIALREVQARAQGRIEGQAEGRKGYEEQLARERAALAAALAGFTRDRAAYFEKIEGEVVQLALAIARKILHREAQIDPWVLAGIVRVALEKIDGATGVRLRVHPQNSADWRRYLATHLHPADLPEFVEDPSQPPDRCVLETSMGSATIGLEVQLKEIEQGLMDLLAARPAGADRGDRS